MTTETITADSCLADLEALMRDVPLALRQKHADAIQRIARMCSIDPRNSIHLCMRVSDWPDRKREREDALDYLVDFNYGESPDARNFMCSLKEACLLLNYTQKSFKVAMSQGGGKIDRTRHSTRLGPCIVHRLRDVAKFYPDALRLSERERSAKPASRFRIGANR